MSEYLATGRNPEGKKVTERLEAETADEAVQDLRDRGFEDIVLHTDDVGARYTCQSAVDSVISPREFLWFRDLPAPLAGFFLVTIKLYRRSWFSALAMLALLAYRRYDGRPWGSLDTLFAVFLLLPPAWALAAQFMGGAAARYQQLIEATAWGRWEEVLRRVDSVGGPVAPDEIAFRKAEALAALGRIDEALEVVEPFSDGEAMPDWLYASRLPEIYLAAGRRDAAIGLTEKALALAPDNSTIILELARLEIRYRRDPKRARALLERARTHALSDTLLPFVTYIEGLILLEEGRAREAYPLLEQAYRGASAFRHASPLIGSALDLMHAAMALALAEAGDIEAARRHNRLARPRLVALKVVDLIERCDRAVGPA